MCCSSCCFVFFVFLYFLFYFFFFFFTDTATSEIYTLSLHDALPSPSAGDAQIISAKITTPTKTTTTFDFTMPTSRTNGAGANGTLYSQNPPIIQAWALNNGNQNTSAVITLNTSSNFNVFQVGGLGSLIKSMIKVTF